MGLTETAVTVSGSGTLIRMNLARDRFLPLARPRAQGIALLRTNVRKRRLEEIEKAPLT